jgi:glycosyltransferase involved in cell wall biosynthesis
MSKTIWFISKYCMPELKDSVGSRGWLLMKEFANRGNKTVVITSNSNHLNNLTNLNLNKINYSPEGIVFIILNTYKHSIAKSFGRVLSWFNFEWNLFWLDKRSLPKPDVIIISSLSLLTILNGFFFKKKYHCKLVFEIRDIWPLTLIEEGGYKATNPLIIFLSLIERWGYKKSDIIIGTMPKLAKHVHNVLGYPKLVHCIPMGIDKKMLTRIEKIDQNYINQYLNPNFFNIIYAGTVGITNALENFFHSAEILKNNPKIRFVIIGDGALKKVYKKKYGYLKNLIFAPKIKKNQVQSALACADILYFSVFKSKVWEYGQSLNKIIDYMISKKPILASYSGYPSMINEADCGFFLPAQDTKALVKKIEQLFNMTKNDRLAIGANSLCWLLKNRTYQKLADNYLKILFG